MTKQRKKDRPEGNKVGSPGDGMGVETSLGRKKEEGGGLVESGSYTIPNIVHTYMNPGIQEPVLEKAMQAYGCLKESQRVSKRIKDWYGRWGLCCDFAGLDALPSTIETRSGTVANGCEHAEPPTVRNEVSSYGNALFCKSTSLTHSHSTHTPARSLSTLF